MVIEVPTNERRKPSGLLPAIRHFLNKREGFVCVPCISEEIGAPAPEVNRALQHRSLVGFAFLATTCKVCNTLRAWCVSDRF